MFLPSETSVIWYVCFHPGRRLWSREYCHVSLAGYFDLTWVHLDMQRDGLSVATLYRHDDVENYLSFLLTHYAVVKMDAGGNRSFFGRPMTCVSFVKHALGIRSGALRPDALFRDLLRNHGGEWINADGKSRRDRRTESAAHSGEAGERPVHPGLSPDQN
ncbi:hypothetical protein [Pseudooceanicola nitratireducens]|uniref:hypothetical protein n=1 Tax=Pseudooceanicola nitratireducens TaxID=517719 RepID=UPI003C7B2138